MGDRKVWETGRGGKQEGLGVREEWGLGRGGNVA